MKTTTQFNYYIISVFIWYIVYFALARKVLIIFDNTKRSIDYNKFIACILFTSLGIQMILALFSHPNDVDLGFFINWSETLADTGFYHFYDTVSFVDYPPGFFPVLYCLGKIQHLFNINSGHAIHLLYKLPCIALLLSASLFFAFVSTKKSKNSNAMSAVIVFLCAFSPCLWSNSVLWGQLDVLLSFLIVLSLYFLYLNRPVPSAFFFTLAFLCKSQALLFAPIFIIYIVETLFTSFKNHLAKKIVDIMLGICLAFVIYSVYTLMFIQSKENFWWLLHLYFDAFDSYPMASLGAMNFYGLLGLSGAAASTPIVGNMTADLLSKIMIFLGILLAGVIILLRKDSCRYIAGSCVLYVWVYTFATKMHERYLAPIIFPLLLLFVLSKARRHLILFLCLSSVCLMSTMRALCSYWLGINTDNNWLAVLFSGIAVLSALALTASEFLPAFGTFRKRSGQIT